MSLRSSKSSSERRTRNNPAGGTPQSSRSRDRGHHQNEIHVNPFASNAPNGHTSFGPRRPNFPTPSEMSRGTVPPPSSLKPPKAPEKPTQPYMRFSKKMWEAAKVSNPDAKMWDIGKILGAQWRDLPDLEKQPFIEEYETEKTEYEKAMKAYRNSPAYQAYLQMKGNEDKSRSNQAPENRGRVFIQPVEEDDGPEQPLTVKHLAAARFHRNHTLIAEILNPSTVPDMRGIISVNRLNSLKKQVFSLGVHEKKLLTELQQLEQKFQAKKQRIETDRKNFEDNLEKLNKSVPVVSKDQFEKMVESSKQRLLEAFETWKLRQQEAEAAKKVEELKRVADAEIAAKEAALAREKAAEQEQRGEKEESKTNETGEKSDEKAPDEAIDTTEATGGDKNEASKETTDAVSEETSKSTPNAAPEPDSTNEKDTTKDPTSDVFENESPKRSGVKRPHDDSTEDADEDDDEEEDDEENEEDFDEDSNMT